MAIYNKIICIPQIKVTSYCIVVSNTKVSFFLLQWKLEN